MTQKCNKCGSKNTYGMSRVVGYYSIIENWNNSKKAELFDRQKGDYKLTEESRSPLTDKITATNSQEVVVVE